MHETRQAHGVSKLPKLFHKKWDKKAILGLGLLGISYILGAVLKNSAQLTSSATPRGFSGNCDTYVRWLCIPTYYFTIHLAKDLWLVLNFTSILAGVVFFIFGVLFLRE